MLSTSPRESTRHSPTVLFAFVVVALILTASIARATDQIYFPAVDNTTALIVQRINAETVRLDISAWYLTEPAISQAIANRFAAGVAVRLIGDAGSIFDIDTNTKMQFYWLANRGIPIRLRYQPTWYPEIDHWKAAIFVGQNVVEFGSANWTVFELAPYSSTNYDDETVMFTDDPVLVGAFKTKFDQIWNDTMSEPESMAGGAPYFKNWNDACAVEPACSDYRQLYPNPAPMNISTARLEPDNPMPADLIWGQGPSFNNRLITEINNEPAFIQFVVYRLTVPNITQALLNKWQSGVPVQLIIEPNEYLNRAWPEFWLTHAYIDMLWAAGVPIKQRLHQGLTHMKTLITSSYATNASSNYAAAWQRDHDYFVSATGKPLIYQALHNRFQTMWNDGAGFAPFAPQAPDSPALQQPASGSSGVTTNTTLVWNTAVFATSYDIYLGTSSSALAYVGNVPAQLVNSPPATYSWQASALQPGTTYYWQVVSKTFANRTASSPVWTFTTSGAAPPPPPPEAGNREDFNLDGHSDLMWQNDVSGQATVWYMSGAQGNSFQGWTYLTSSNMSGWHIVGTGDFNGDGRPDVVWQNDSTRQATVWYLGGPQGTTVVAWNWLTSQNYNGWRIAAVADFNGDGKPDLVWQNTATRQAVVWYMSGAQGNVMGSWAWLTSSDEPGWNIVAVADFNRDGKPDLVWQNDTTRQVTVWYMSGAQGTTMQSWAWISSDGLAGWHVVGSRDFDGNGSPDVVWQNDGTRQATVWFMGGAQGNTMTNWAWVTTSSSVAGWTLIVR